MGGTLTTTTADDAARSDTEPTEPEAPPTEPTTPDTPPEEPDTGDAAKWKALARKHESDLKKATKALADKERAALSDQERAIAEAKEAGRAEARRENATEIVKAKLEAAGVSTDVIDDLNLARFIGDDGAIDSDALTATASRLAAAKPKPAAPPVPTGPQNTGGQPNQLTRADLASMKPEQIEEARQAGRLNELLGIKT